MRPCKERASSACDNVCHVTVWVLTVVFPDLLLVLLAFLAKAVFSLDVRPAETDGAMAAAAWQDDIACCVALGGGLWRMIKP